MSICNIPNEQRECHRFAICDKYGKQILTSDKLRSVFYPLYEEPSSYSRIAENESLKYINLLKGNGIETSLILTLIQTVLNCRERNQSRHQKTPTQLAWYQQEMVKISNQQKI